jgi:hypothetical protein
MGFYDAFFGSDQSQYTAYAIVAAIIAICITILLTATDIPVSNRVLIVFFVIITLIPSVFLTLFELTCIVTGGTEPNKWWCYAFAWILAIFIIIYCIFIIIISLISLFTYNNAIDNLKETENKSRLSPEVSNNYAKQIIDTDEKHVEKFNDMENELRLLQQQNDNKEEQSFDPASMMSSITNQIMPGVNEGFEIDPTASPSSESFTQNTKTVHEEYNTRRNSKIQLGNGPKPEPEAQVSEFTNFGSINLNGDFEDNRYFSYDELKNTN